MNLPFDKYAFYPYTETMSLSLLFSEIFNSPHTIIHILLHKASSCAEFDRIKIRAIYTDAAVIFHAEQFKNPQMFHANYTSQELRTFLEDAIGKQYKTVEIETENERLMLLTNKRGEVRIMRKKGAGKNNVPAANNRVKKYLIAEGEPIDFLIALGIQTKEGKIVASRYDKFRQINRFLEYIDDVLPYLLKDTKEGESLSIVDFACGKSYLTFAAYYFLTAVRGLCVQMVGLDLKKDLIAFCNTVAHSCRFDNLHFYTGDIASVTADTAGKNFHIQKPDMVISLHACDTATDYVLAQAIQWDVRVILSVPCCQHELNSQLDALCHCEVPHIDDCKAPQTPLEALFSYGIIKERFASLATDVLRAQLLEISGYRTQIMEFIDMEHTAKNLLIRAVKADIGMVKTNARVPEDMRRKKARVRYEELRDFLQVQPMLANIIGKDNLQIKE